MARVLWAHACDHAFYDAQGKPCLIGVFTAIFAKRVPVTHSRCAFAFRVEGAPHEELELTAVMVRPDARDPLFELPPRKVNLGPGGHHNAIVDLSNLPVPDFGRYEFRILLNGKCEFVLPFEVVRSVDTGATDRGG